MAKKIQLSGAHLQPLGPLLVTGLGMPSFARPCPDAVALRRSVKVGTPQPRCHSRGVTCRQDRGHSCVAGLEPRFREPQLVPGSQGAFFL